MAKMAQVELPKWVAEERRMEAESEPIRFAAPEDGPTAEELSDYLAGRFLAQY